MSKGRPLEGAPGWRVMESQRRAWPAGLVILPVAILVGLLQILMPSASERAGWMLERWVQTSDATSSNAEATIDASQAERQALGERAGRPAEIQQARLPNPIPLVGNGAVDEFAAPETGPTRVLIHHQAGTPGAVSAMQLAAYLQTQGFAVTDIRAVDIPIEHPGVRYFFEGDQSDGQRLAEAIGDFYAKTPGQAPHEARDFSHLSPKPQQGNVEVWLSEPGSGGTS